ncbi:jg22639 [Pararge aegeria aegeria]|uniref:Jg22639 protein n=1 Tax=Pararge aegeria aegeria TaxID=348720 RepID=A0A8S4R743_9NEOP|nr:jg22639 [Pararge aegeria aegeria]
MCSVLFTWRAKHLHKARQGRKLIRIQASDSWDSHGGRQAALAHPPARALLARKHDFYYHLNARKRHVNCVVCRTLSKHRSDYFVYASGAKPRYKFETL